MEGLDRSEEGWLLDLLIPEALAVVEVDGGEAGVLKLFDEPVVACHAEREGRGGEGPLHGEGLSVFALRSDPDVVTFFEKSLLQVFGHGYSIGLCGKIHGRADGGVFGCKGPGQDEIGADRIGHPNDCDE